MSASQNVFHVPELIEAILIHLPPRDLLLSQRISTHFLTTIRRSPTLQKLLFLLPESDDADDASVILVDTTLPPSTITRLPPHWDTNVRAAAQVPAASIARARHTGPLMRRVRVNPLLLYAAPDYRVVRQTVDVGHIGPVRRRVRVNPHLRAPSDHDAPPKTVDEYVATAAGFKVRDAIIDGFTRSHDEDGDASWRRMLLTQPPVDRVHKREEYPMTRSREECWVLASGAPGLRMGEVAAQLERRPREVVPRGSSSSRGLRIGELASQLERRLREVVPRGSRARLTPLLELYLMGAADGAAFDTQGRGEEMKKRTVEWKARTGVIF